VIGSFKHKGLAELYEKGKTRYIGSGNAKKCERILQSLDAAAQPEEMNLPGLRFHGLQGGPKRWSVHVSANYRITFGWAGENAIDVDFEDYH
jgi:proteic killer suppression protein